MTRKETLKNEIVMKMRYHLGKNELAMLDETLSECLYQVEIVDATTLPATVENSNEYIYIRGDKTKKLQKSGIYAEIKRIAADSGINKRVYPHIYRHTVATNVIKRGGTVYDAGCYLGHKGSDVTQKHYIAQRDSEEVFRKYVQAI